MADTPEQPLTPLDVFDDSLMRIIMARIQPTVQLAMSSVGVLTVEVRLVDTKTQPDGQVYQTKAVHAEINISQLPGSFSQYTNFGYPMS